MFDYFLIRTLKFAYRNIEGVQIIFKHIESLNMKRDKNYNGTSGCKPSLVSENCETTNSVVLTFYENKKYNDK